MHSAKSEQAVANSLRSLSPKNFCTTPPFLGRASLRATSIFPALVAASTEATSILPLMVSENETTASPNDTRFALMVEKSSWPPKILVIPLRRSALLRVSSIPAILSAASTELESMPSIASVNFFAPRPKIAS